MSASVPSGTTDDFAQMWAWFATHCHGTSPLYEQICLAVAGDRALLEYLRTVPPAAQLPLSLLAAVHYLVLEGADPALAAIYAGEAHEDPGPLFLDFWRAHRDAVDHILATRHIQTNDCGRSALIAPALTWVADRFARPLALVDVGASAGLNLRCDTYRIDYGSFGATGPDDSPVRIECEVVGGRPPIAPRLPPIVSRIGIDRSPVDLGDPDDVRWLLACVWPDSGRLERTAASIRLAQAQAAPPKVVAADANDVVPGILAGLPDGALATVVTTWAFAYFAVDQRQEFIGHLAAASRDRDVAWLSAEGPGTVEPLGAEVATHPDRAGSDILGAVLFQNGVQEARLLGFAQGHGGWIDWRAA